MGLDVATRVLVTKELKGRYDRGSKWERTAVGSTAKPSPPSPNRSHVPLQNQDQQAGDEADIFR